MTDSDLLEVSFDFREGILNGGSPEGMCAAVSMALRGYLSAMCGVSTEIVETDLSENPNSQFYEHVWLRLDDGRVLDATFDQFCSEAVPVYLGKPTEFHVSPSHGKEAE